MWKLGLWKVVLKESIESDEVIFWAYNFDEKSASKAAIRWAAKEHAGKTFAISSIDKQAVP